MKIMGSRGDARGIVLCLAALNWWILLGMAGVLLGFVVSWFEAGHDPAKDLFQSFPILLPTALFVLEAASILFAMKRWQFSRGVDGLSAYWIAVLCYWLSMMVTVSMCLAIYEPVIERTSGSDDRAGLYSMDATTPEVMSNDFGDDCNSPL
jgi:hypothetical protein